MLETMTRDESTTRARDPSLAKVNGTPREAAGGLIRVVLADDVAAFRMIVSLVIDGDDRFEIVAEVADGAEAIRACAEHKPDAILLDIAMPIVDGRRAIPRIRACSPETSIIVFSAFARDQLERASLTVGADAYLEKNGRISGITATIVETVAKRSAR
jgi:DNA-binding NarL/FixJ family response regulator